MGCFAKKLGNPSPRQAVRTKKGEGSAGWRRRAGDCAAAEGGQPAVACHGALAICPGRLYWGTAQCAHRTVLSVICDSPSSLACHGAKISRVDTTKFATGYRAEIILGSPRPKGTARPSWYYV